MAQYQSTTSPTAPEPGRMETIATDVASPAPLGLSILAFTTAILGCYYAGFIIPFEAPGMRTGLAAMLLVGGIILILAGMWEYRKNYMVTATTFTSYGGFLAALGLTFMPNLGILRALSDGGELHYALGLFFLCWTIFTGVLFLGALRMNASLAVTMIVLLATYLFLTIGQLASNNVILLNIGGWLAIACAIVAWTAAAASIVSTSSAHGTFRLPLGRRLAVVE
ncbi:MAG: hypothetical protein NVS3B14_23520 [Ktedonobacteraceae bacterium]